MHTVLNFANWARRWGTLLRVVVALAAVAFVVSRADLSEVYTVLAGTLWTLSVVGAVASLTLHVLSALGWRAITVAAGLELSRRTAIHLYYQGQALAGITPAGLGGDALRAIRLARDVSFLVPLSSIFISRALSYAVVVGLAAASATILGATRSDLPSEYVAAGMVVLFAIAITIAVAAMSGPIAQKLTNRLVARFSARGEQMQEGLLKLLHKPGAVGRAGILFAIFHILSGLAAYVLAYSIDIRIDLLTFIGLVLIVRAVSLLPISIGGLGIRELAFVAVLGQVGIGTEAAIGLALLDRAALMLGLLLGFALIRPGRRASRSSADETSEDGEPASEQSLS